MAEKWMQKAFNPAHKGMLHKALHVPKGKPIPHAKLEHAEASKNSHMQHMAQAAENAGGAAHMSHIAGIRAMKGY